LCWYGAVAGQVLVDAGYRPVSDWKAGDIVTWPLFAHSAILKTLVRKPDGSLDPLGTTFDSKNGQDPRETSSLEKLIRLYGPPQYAWRK
jgi:hypothetical protein